MPISRIDLINRSLPRAFRGYDVEATDRLVQDLSDALARASDEKVALMTRLADCEAKIAAYTQREASVHQALASGQRMGEALRASAQKEAMLILEKARIRADGLVQNANVRLARILEEVAEAQKAKVRFEAHLKRVIQDHLRLLELNRQESASLEDAHAKLAPDQPVEDGVSGV